MHTKHIKWSGIFFDCHLARHLVSCGLISQFFAILRLKGFAKRREKRNRNPKRNFACKVAYTISYYDRNIYAFVDCFSSCNCYFISGRNGSKLAENRGIDKCACYRKQQLSHGGGGEISNSHNGDDFMIYLLLTFKYLAFCLYLIPWN